MEVNSGSDIEKIYQSNFYEGCPYANWNTSYAHDKYTLEKNLHCVFKTARNIRKFKKLYYQYDFIHIDAYVTFCLLVIFILVFLMSLFQMGGRRKVKAHLLDPVFCLAVTCMTMYRIWFRDINTARQELRKLILGSVEFNIFIDLCAMVLCMICVSCLSVYFYGNMCSDEPKYKCDQFVRTVSRRLVPYMSWLLIRGDYSFFSLSTTERVSVIRELTLFFVYYVLFFLLSEILDLYLTCLKDFSWRHLFIIVVCIWFCNKHCYKMMYWHKDKESLHLYLGWELTWFNILMYSLTKLFLLYR
ncbi:protein E9 [Elephant endotheliotropic herpesvirus 5B]|nr:protein E9 [Elephant endotheliotropic herpesvirus 5B]